VAEQKLIRDLFIRIARDGNYKIDATQVAHLVAGILKIHPLEVGAAFPYIHVMNQVAAGTHPAVNS
tara:strand:- start:317 stop:514 length:198 start_codon:yes stop_codon:yes gene_type:complete